MVQGIESLSQAAADSGSVGACIPIWLAGAVVAPLAAAVTYQTRRVLDLTKRIEHLTDRYLDHYEDDSHAPGA